MLLVRVLRYAREMLYAMSGPLSKSHVKAGSGTVIACWRIRGVCDGLVSVGDGSLVHANIVMERSGARLSIGSRSFIGKSILSIADSVEIGDDVMISWGATITDHDSHSINFNDRRYDVKGWMRGEKSWEHIRISRVVIESKAWIGFNSIILKGVRVGEGSIVAAGAVVTKDVEPWTIVAGNPAKVVKILNADE